jgi:hypothetical protein
VTCWESHRPALSHDVDIMRVRVYKEQLRGWWIVQLLAVPSPELSAGSPISSSCARIISMTICSPCQFWLICVMAMFELNSQTATQQSLLSSALRDQVKGWLEQQLGVIGSTLLTRDSFF